MLSIFALFALGFCKPVAYVWSPSNLTRNRTAHVLHGNGATNKGKGTQGKKGKGKGKQNSTNIERPEISQNPFGNVATEHHHLSQMFGLVQQQEAKQVDKTYRDRVRAALPAAAQNASTPLLVDGKLMVSGMLQFAHLQSSLLVVALLTFTKINWQTSCVV